MIALAERVAAHDTSVLLLGETGTGKDRLARAIHEASPRQKGAFVRIDCAALSPDLFESELFGHEKGAFTDARERRIGRLEAATGGTIYFDRIDGLPRDAQAKLLRVLQQRTVNRLGSAREIALDVRIIASTTLSRTVLAERVRGDLLYRIDVFPIELPPLRARVRDVRPLAVRIASDLRSGSNISDDAIEVLERHDWPGNVQELRNVIERALVVARAHHVTPADLPQTVRNRVEMVDHAAFQEWSLEQVEREYIARILERTGGNASAASRILGIARKTLLEKRKRYGLDREEET